MSAHILFGGSFDLANDEEDEWDSIWGYKLPMSTTMSTLCSLSKGWRRRMEEDGWRMEEDQEEEEGQDLKEKGC